MYFLIHATDFSNLLSDENFSNKGLSVLIFSSLANVCFTSSSASFVLFVKVAEMSS